MHRAPKSKHYARQLFDCVIEYNSRFNGLVCDLASLSHELKGRDVAWAQYSKQQLDQRLSHIVSTVTAQTRQLLLLNLPQGHCTASLIAQQLNMSSRTLHRQLVREQTSYLALLTSLRRELVMQLVISSDHTVIEIAQQLGFANGSVFAHWFYKQFNTSLRQWRQLAQLA